MGEDVEFNQSVQTQKMEALGRFAGGIAHDFNNLLSIIEGHMYVSMKQLNEGSLKQEQLQKILRSTQQGAALTRRLLSFGRQKVDAEEKIDLAQILREQQTLLHPLLGETIKLYMTMPSEEPVWINAAPDQITQIILNLALNSRDAMPEGGELAVICRYCAKRHVPRELREKYPGQAFARLSVVDSGTGIPSEVLPRIFDPFFTTKEVGKGTGLGLSVVYGIVEQLKGKLEVSSALGLGASFDIYLPLASSPVEEAVVHETPAGMDLAGKTILVTEDEPELRALLTDMLDGMHMKVLSAWNGDHALVVQQEYDGKIDFLLTDVVMPGMDGVKLAEKFHDARPDSNVIYMSGYPFMDGRKDIRVPKDAPFLAKPFPQEKMQQILERALMRRSERLADEDEI